MDAILQSLLDLGVKALPTLLLVVFLHFYLRAVFFRPMEKILRERHEKSGGSREHAAEAVRRAEEKTAEYEAALRQARAEVYHEMERNKRVMEAEQSARVAEARRSAESHVSEAKASLDAEYARLSRELGDQAEVLAGRMAEILLRGKAA